MLGLIALETAEQLLLHPHHQALLRQIASLTSLPEQHFVDFVQIAITNFARFVQRLPASEAHHHARLDGMLDHGLEVTATALLIRRGHLLPKGAEPEEIARKHDLWTYAVLIAALLHDIGKLIVDQIVTLHDAHGKAIGPWTPWAGPMDAITTCAGYRIEFARKRYPQLHERVTPLIVHHLLPPCALSWLASDPEVFATWLAAITGDYDHAGPLGEIIRQADSESVARNLASGDGAPRPAAFAKPLQEKLLTRLRYLLSKDEFPLNRHGAAGWVVDNDLWLASEWTVDVLRAWMAEGQGVIPLSNERIFALLQEQGIVLPCGDRAIWQARVTGDGWEQDLTLLRLPVQKVWPELDRCPDPFSGTVMFLENCDDDTELQRVVSPVVKSGTGHPEDTEDCAQGPATAMSVFPDLNELSRATFLPEATMGKEVKKKNEVAEKPVVQAAVPADKNSSTAVSVGKDDPGQQFLTWLQEGLTAECIEVNNANARVHIVAEGVLLVSPGIFKDFVTGHPIFNDWNAVQKRFLKLKLHRKTAIGTTIHHYQVKNLRKKHINGLLIPDVTHLFRERSAPLPSSRLVPDIE